MNRAQDIRDAVAFADRVKVKLIISGGSDAPRVAGLLKEKNIPVILGNVLTLPSTEDSFHAESYQIAGQLAAAGVKVAFSTGDSAYVRIVPYHAAMSVAWGMNRDEALKALTINAAEILGVADRVGSLEVGQGRQPVRVQRRSARSQDRGHSRLHPRQERRDRQQAGSAVPEVHRSAIGRAAGDPGSEEHSGTGHT